MLNNQQKYLLKLVFSRFDKRLLKNTRKNYLYQAISENKLLPLFYVLSKKYNLDIFSQSQKQQLKSVYLTNLSIYQKQKQATAEIAGYFNKKNIPVIFFKGVVLNDLIYKQEAVRSSSNDIDILVKKSDFYKAAGILKNLGYEGSLVSIRKKEITAEHFFSPGKIMVDLHFKLNVFPEIPDIDAKFYWQKFSLVNFENVKIGIFPQEILFICLCHLILRERITLSKFLGYFLDLHYFLLSYAKKLDYNYLADVLLENKFNVFILIVLDELEKTSGINYGISPEFRRKIKSSAIRKKIVKKALVNWRQDSECSRLSYLVNFIFYSGGYLKVACGIFISLFRNKHLKYLDENNFPDNYISWLKHLKRIIKNIFKPVTR